VDTRRWIGFIMVSMTIMMLILGGPMGLGMAGFLWFAAAAVMGVHAFLKIMGVDVFRGRRAENGKMRIHPIVGWLVVAALIIGANNLSLLAFLFVGALVVVTIALVAEEMRTTAGIRTGNIVIDACLHRIALAVTQAFQPLRANRAAELAMRRAGNRADRTALYLVDIGLLVYFGEHSEPRIYRLSEIPTDATHIRPFAVLYQPRMEATSGQGVVRFNLLDDRWKLRYTSGAHYKVRTGENFITPKTWLLLDDEHVSDAWLMEVNVGDRLLGVHEIAWLEVGGKLRAEFNGEGELDEKRRRWAEMSMTEPLPVDELLEEQGDEVYEPQVETGAIGRS
jgi:hypothetical protein